MVPEIHTNGCKLAKEPVISRRRSARRGGTGYSPAARPRALASWALSPQAVEAIRAQILLGVGQRRAVLAYRDATIVGLQYGLATRNQEVWGLRWTSLNGEFAWVSEVLSYGQLEHNGARPHAAPSDAPPYPAPCEKTSSTGARSSENPGTQPATPTSSSPET
jgi:hypothetical protein